MAEWAYSSIEIKGEVLDLNEFEKIAFKSVTEAFCLKNIIPLPKNYKSEKAIEKFNTKVLENCRGVYYSILAYKDDNCLIYFVVSKWTGISVSAISEKYQKLNFINLSDCESGNFAYFMMHINHCEWEDYCFYTTEFNWQIPLPRLSFQHLEILKLHYFSLANEKPQLFGSIFNIWEKCEQFNDFFDIFPRIPFLKANKKYYERVYNTSVNLNLPEAKYMLDSVFFSNIKMDYYSRLKYIKEFIVDTKLNKQLLKELITEILANADSAKPEKSLTDSIVYIYLNYNFPAVLYKICKKHIQSRILAIKDFKKNYDDYCRISDEMKYFRPIYIENSSFISEVQEINPWSEIADIMEQYKKENVFSYETTSDFDINFHNQYEILIAEKTPDKEKLISLFTETLKEYNLMKKEYYKNSSNLGFAVELKTKITVEELESLAQKAGVLDLMPDFGELEKEFDDLPF